VERHSKQDEYLEVLYHLREDGHSSDVKVLAEHYNEEHGHKEGDQGFDPAMVSRLADQLLVAVEGDRISLTDVGFKKAEQIIRRHRLAERLLADVLHMKSSEFEAAACEFEHVVAEEIAESICILLGHPRTCPHGSPIPEGPCCKAGAAKVESAAVPLSEVPVGSTVRVAYVNALSEARQHQLTHFDIVPGNIIRLHQLKPAVVIVHDGSMFAMESAVAQKIYVWKSWKDDGQQAAKDTPRPPFWKRFLSGQA